MLLNLLKRIHVSVFICWVVFFFCLSYPVLFYASRNPSKHFKLLSRGRYWIAQLSAWFSGIYFKFNKSQPIDWDRNYIICANHTSLLDIAALAIFCKRDMSFVGKIELLKNPITRLFFNTIDIPVDRSSKISSYKAFKLAQQRLVEGRNIIIFPEGGIEDEFPPKLREFKNGAFKLAIEMEVPVLPVVIHDLWKILWDAGQMGSRPGICSITVLQAIETKAMGTDQAVLLKEDVWKLFNQHLNP